MSITVHIPTLLRPLTQDQKRVEASGNNVLEVIRHLESQHPGIKDRLMQDGKLHRFMNIYVNDNDIRFAGELQASLVAGDTLTILPAVAGGSGRYADAGKGAGCA